MKVAAKSVHETQSTKLKLLSTKLLMPRYLRDGVFAGHPFTCLERPEALQISRDPHEAHWFELMKGAGEESYLQPRLAGWQESLVGGSSAALINLNGRATCTSPVFDFRDKRRFLLRTRECSTWYEKCIPTRARNKNITIRLQDDLDFPPRNLRFE